MRKNRRGRPPGKRYFQQTLALTQEQIDYLKQQPNASAVIRKLLDDLIAVGKDINVGVIALNNQLRVLEEEKRKLTIERERYFNANSSQWKRCFDASGQWFLELDDSGRPKPLDSHDAKVAYQVLKGYDDAIARLNAKIGEIKDKIVQTAI